MAAVSCSFQWLAVSARIMRLTPDVDVYNAHHAKLQAIAADQEKLDQDFRAEVEMSQKGFSGVLAGAKGGG